MSDTHRTTESLAPSAPAAGPKRPAATKRENVRSILSTVAVLLIAPLIAVVLTAFVFQSYQVDGESMETTLQNNDRLIVWKVPRTISRISGHAYIPNRGDVVVFTEPSLDQFGQDPSKQLIKRVVGLPGEKVVVKDGELIVYNLEHPDGFKPDKTLPYGDVIKNTTIENTWSVQEDQLFVVGDNRTNSMDSRTFGPIDAHNVVGKLVARVLPIGNVKRF